MSDLDIQLQQIKDELGALLRSAREARSYSQGGVERDVGISQGMLSKLERGVSEALVSFDLASSLAESLRLDERELRRLLIKANIVRHFRRTDVTVEEIKAAARSL